MYLAIRKAKDSDAENVYSVTRQSFSLYQEDLHVTYEVKALTETLDAVRSDIKNNTVYVAERNGEIVGSIRCKKLSDELVYIYRFGVSPIISNSGMGSMLLDAVIEKCRSENIKAIALHTNSKYYRLARYYYGKGFYVHSTSSDRGYIRALFVLELENNYDLTPAFAL